MLLTHSRLAGNAPGMRRRRDMLHRRQTLGHNLLNGLVDFWPLDEQAGTRRGVHAAQNLSNINFVTGADGVGGLACQFGGAANLLRASETALQTGDIDYMLSIDLYMDAKPGASMALMDKGTSTVVREYMLQWVQSSDRFRFLVYNGGSTLVGNVSTGSAPSLSTWYRIFAYHSATNNEVGIAVNDGAAVTAATTGAAGSTTGNFSIGLDAGGTQFWQGRLANGLFAKRVWAAEERSWYYNGGVWRRYPFI